jgi:hypothetical protein
VLTGRQVRMDGRSEWAGGQRGRGSLGPNEGRGELGLLPRRWVGEVAGVTTDCAFAMNGGASELMEGW